MTSDPQPQRKKMMIFRYPTTATYICYIAVVVTILLLLQVFWHG